MEKQKYAIVFAGQGAQKPGMGKSLYESSAAARAVMDEAGDAIKHDCFEADAERLRQTEVTQPAVYTMDMAAYAALREALRIGEEDGLSEPAALAGFSLGEYAAFTAAGVIQNLSTGLEIVKQRSLMMKEASTNPDGSQRGTMAAGMGDQAAVLALVEKARGEDILEAVNFNSPQQTVVAGDFSAVERFAALAAEDRSLGVKAIPLSVSGAFHSPLMLPASGGLAAVVAEYSFGEPTLPIYLNATGDIYENFTNPKFPSPDASLKARGNMVLQIYSPVQWQKIIEAMVASGITTIIEVGPGKTLTGLTKKIAPEITALHVEDAETLAETVASLN